MEKEAYKTTYENEKTYWWYQARADIVENVFARAAGSKAGEILNLGCGTGYISRRFEKFGRLTNIDYSEDALAFCARNQLDSLAKASGLSLPLKSDSFDACLALDVLEHIKEDGQAVAEIFRVLKPGGFLLMTVPAFQWLWSSMDDLALHIRRYTGGQARNLLKQAKFQPVILSYYNFFMFPAAILYLWHGWISSKKKAKGDFVPRLPPVFNRLFYLIFVCEKFWIGRLTFPFGLSILALAKKE